MSDQPGFNLVIGYASDMGTAEFVAMQLAEAAQQAGIDTEEVELNTIAPEDLGAATHLVVVASTWGDGELPDNGALFWETLSGDDAPALPGLSFTVCGLGDSSYPLYNNAARIIDARLEELGAVRIADRIEYDNMFNTGEAAGWISDIAKLMEAAQTASGTEKTEPTAVTVVPEADAAPVWDRRHLYPATLVAARLLTSPDSAKEVWHYELDLGDSGIAYAAGDSLAVQPVNDPALVQAVLAALGEAGDRIPDGHSLPLAELLTGRELRAPSRELRALVAERSRDREAAAALSGADTDVLTAWLYGRDLVDLLETAELSVAELLDTVRPLTPRDYSIASTPLADPSRVALTVASVRYRLGGRDRAGTASTFLADRRAVGDTVEVHLRPNQHFRLPEPDVPIIMIGPGTGIAPFRAFLAERQATGAGGRSWLFFGDRRRATDYLYREDLERFVADGTLDRLDLAFSRDGADGTKTYVWHHMLEHAAELYSWLQDGARIYVCGDANQMARDVDRALHTVVADAGGLAADAAHAYVNDLIRTHRYLRDVY